MKYYFFVFCIVAILISCNDDDPSPDTLATLGILGTWEIHGETINGITNMAVQCCAFLELSPEGNPDDYSGNYRAYGVGYETSGRFTLDESTRSLTTFSEGRQEVFTYLIRDDLLEIAYTEAGDLIDQTYIKRE